MLLPVAFAHDRRPGPADVAVRQAVPSGPGKAFDACSRQIDWRSRLLERGGNQADFGELEEFTIVSKRLALPRHQQDVERFLEPLAIALLRHFEIDGFPGATAATDSEIKSALTEMG